MECAAASAHQKREGNGGHKGPGNAQLCRRTACYVFLQRSHCGSGWTYSRAVLVSAARRAYIRALIQASGDVPFWLQQLAGADGQLGEDGKVSVGRVGGNVGRVVERETVRRPTTATMAGSRDATVYCTCTSLFACRADDQPVENRSQDTSPVTSLWKKLSCSRSSVLSFPGQQLRAQYIHGTILRSYRRYLHMKYPSFSAWPASSWVLCSMTGPRQLRSAEHTTDGRDCSIFSGLPSCNPQEVLPRKGSPSGRRRLPVAIGHDFGGSFPNAKRV